jgi:hypothetical protein
LVSQSCHWVNNVGKSVTTTLKYFDAFKRQRNNLEKEHHDRDKKQQQPKHNSITAKAKSDLEKKEN